MASALSYIVARFTHRILEFFEHWYVGSFRVVGTFTLGVLRRLDGVFALAVTLRYFFRPLYQDRTFIGHILGFIFRSVRALIAIIVYTVVILIISAVYLVWLLIIPYIAYEIFRNFMIWKNV